MDTAPLPAEMGGLAAYVEQAPTPIYVWERIDGDFRLTRVNEAARRFTGARIELLLGQTAIEAGDGRTDFADDLQRCVDEGAPVSREVTDTPFRSGSPRNLVLTWVSTSPDRVLLHIDDLTAQRAGEARLRAAEERYRTLLQVSTEGIWVVDSTGGSIFANQRVTRLLGHPTDELLARRIIDFVDPVDCAAMQAAIQNPRDVQPFVAAFRHRDGRVLTFLVSVAPLGGLGSRPATICALADLTALRREQGLRVQAERNYRRVIETANEGVWTIDPDGVTTLVNERMAEMLGVGPEDMIGRPFRDFVRDSSAVAVVQRALARDAQPLRAEVSLLRRDGSRLHTLMSLSALRGEGDELVGGLALVTDITELKRGHEELRESEARFAQVFEAAPVGIAFIAASHLRRGRFLEINAEFRRLLGYSDEQLAKLDHQAVTHRDDREREEQLTRALFERRSDTYEIEKRYVRGDGETLWARVRVALLRDHHGAPLYLIAVAADISARKEAEALAARAARTTGTILEHTSDAVIQMSTERVVTEFSPSAVRLFGYERDEALGRDLCELVVPPALRERMRAAIADYLEAVADDGRSARYQTTAMRADGSEFPVEVAIDVVEGSDPPEFIGSVRSLASEHALVEARREADERFERAFRDGVAGMAVVGLDECFVDVNPALAALTGRPVSELIGLKWSDILAPDELQPAVAWHGRALAGATDPLESTQRVVRHDGRSVRVTLAASLVRREGQAPLHFIHQYMPHSQLDLRPSPAAPSEPLAYRERQVLTLLAGGLDGPAIAQELGLSPETVRSYTQSAREKLGAKTRTHAVALALARGEITL